METQTNNTKKNSIPKWLKVSILIVGVILIIGGLLKILSTSNTFVDKFNEVQVPNSGIKNDLTDIGNILSGTAEKETKKDYTSIISDLQTVLVKLNDIETKIASTSILLTEFQGKINDSSNQNIKTTGTLFIDVFKSKNVATLKMVNDTRNLVNQAIIYYNEIANNQKITIDIKKFIADGKVFAENTQIMTNLSVQYEATANDFAKAAGFTIEKNSK
ncbi:MAG: hypothetical protein Q8L27_01295 [archaeon]|nr:hypothetical protein [archaeon]